MVLRLGTAFLTVAALLAMFYAVENYRGYKAWRDYERQLIARGEALDFFSLLPPSVPDEENFYGTPALKAFADFDPPAKSGEEPVYHQPVLKKRVEDLDSPLDGIYMERASATEMRSPSKGEWMEAFRKANPPKTGSTGGKQAEHLLPWLETDPALVLELREAAARPYSQMVVPFEKGKFLSRRLPHINASLSLAKYFSARAELELLAGKKAEALRDCQVVLRLAEGACSEPILISQLVAVADFSIGAGPVWVGLKKDAWSRGQLLEISKSLERFDFLKSIAAAFRGEFSGFATEMIDVLEDASGRDLRMLLEAGPGTSLVLDAAPRGWFFQNKVEMAAYYYDDVLGSLHLKARTLDIGRLEARIRLRAAAWTGPYNAVSRLGESGSTTVVEKLLRAQVLRDHLRLAIALELYAMDHQGRYPMVLADLVPAHLEMVPLDPCDGKAMRYFPHKNRYVLYSVGWDQIDERGKLYLSSGKRIDVKKGDWVWGYDSSLIPLPRPTNQK